MVGAFGVGKTSLVRRFVEGFFDERYITNIGVKIDRKDVKAGERLVTLMLWDLVGEDAISKLRMSHLRGASGYILVADGCRGWTFDKTLDLHDRIQSALGPLPFLLALNKSDCKSEWEVGAASLEAAVARGWTCLQTSAKTGEGVETLFGALALKLLHEQR
jgi:small GTP-binding protein